MRNFVLSMMLMLSCMSMLASKLDQLPTSTFTVQSVTITGDDCILSVKDVNGTLYYTRGWDFACRDISTGYTLVGVVELDHYPFATPSVVTSLYFQAGVSNKGKIKWSRPFTVSSQWR